MFGHHHRTIGQHRRMVPCQKFQRLFILLCFFIRRIQKYDLRRALFSQQRLQHLLDAAIFQRKPTSNL